MTVEVVRFEAYERVVEITAGNSQGTAFTIDRDGAQYLVTARHILPEGDPKPTVGLTNQYIRSLGRPYEVDLDLLHIAATDADVAVAQLPERITRDTGLEPSSHGLALTQTVFFLGFPYGLATESAAGDQRFAFVKRAIVSAAQRVRDVKCGTSTGSTIPGSRAVPWLPSSREPTR